MCGKIGERERDVCSIIYLKHFPQKCYKIFHILKFRLNICHSKYVVVYKISSHLDGYPVEIK